MAAIWKGHGTFSISVSLNRTIHVSRFSLSSHPLRFFAGYISCLHKKHTSIHYTSTDSWSLYGIVSTTSLYHATVHAIFFHRLLLETSEAGKLHIIRIHRHCLFKYHSIGLGKLFFVVFDIRHVFDNVQCQCHCHRSSSSQMPWNCIELNTIVALITTHHSNSHTHKHTETKKRLYRSSHSFYLLTLWALLFAYYA